MPLDDAGRTAGAWPTTVRLIGLVAVLLFAIAVTKDAWLSDDAFITLRTIDNFWHGYGLRWNPIERVQTYTHPLWMLLLGAAYGVTREPHLTTLAISLAVTAATVWVLLRRLTPAGRAVAFVPLAGSRAFVDYSTSGLENPLSHLLLAAFWLLALVGGAAVAPTPADARDPGEPLHADAPRSGPAHRTWPDCRDLPERAHA